MWVKKGLRKKFLWVCTLIILSVFLDSCMHTKVLSDNITVQQISANAVFEKYTGEKIQLNAKEQSLSGAWGNLQLEPFILQPTIDFIKSQTDYNGLYQLFMSGSQWRFENVSLQEISSLFSEAGLDRDTSDKLLLNTKAIPGRKGFITTPPSELLWNISSATRAKLYELIGQYSNNSMYSEPLCYNSENAEEWLYKSGLSDELTKKLLKLIYVKDGLSYISDIYLVLPSLSSDDEWFHFLQVMYRSRSLEVYLDVYEGQDVSSLVEYWGALGRDTEIRPLLEQASNNQGGAKINISEMLPKIPRDRLNTYSSKKEYESNYKDCHWTTINFFNEEPDERYYKVNNLFTFMDELTVLPDGNSSKYGDIIYIYGQNGEITHSCIYIADNLVFTKNGMGNLNPFMITYLDKTVPLYGDKTVVKSRAVSDTHEVSVE